MLSLFSGSGGFELASTLCGIKPIAASEVEPYPIAVTRARFPDMKHLGDISKVNGAEIEPVDVITFGSPCQDLSVAGRQAGMKHESNGDSMTTRSGLFIEAVRIIKEMRRATNDEYPKFAVWENVPGAFSSNKGEDFRTVLEEIVKIVEPTAPPLPSPEKSGWPYADVLVGDGWSVAYRTFDAQHWGVPQRRRRIYLVADFAGGSARKILFEREGLRGYFAESGTPRKSAPAEADASAGATSETFIIDNIGGQAEYGKESNVNGTLRSGCQGAIAHPDLYEWHGQDSRVKGPIDAACTLSLREGHLVLSQHPVYCLQGNGIDRADTAGCNGKGWREDASYTLNTIDRPAVVYASAPTYCMTTGSFMQVNQEKAPTLAARDWKDPSCVDAWNSSSGRYIVRRLTPTECARLQGFPDRWGHVEPKDTLTDSEHRFWADVRNTHAVINGRTAKDYTADQMLTWYNKLHSDSAEYKMWGNGIALPTALYCMQGIADALNERAE